MNKRRLLSFLVPQEKLDVFRFLDRARRLGLQGREASDPGARIAKCSRERSGFLVGVRDSAPNRAPAPRLRCV